MRKLALLSVLGLALTTAGCGNNNRVTDEERVEALDKLADSVVEQRGVPGIAIAVVRDGKLFHTATAGYSDLSARRPISRATTFQLASTTKIFSSAAILRLVADGKVRLDNPIGDYLEGLPSKWRRVTIRQLLSHTSGLPDIARNTGEINLVADDWDSALAVIAAAPFQFQPGHGWSYTQTNYALLQQVVAKISGVGFEQFLQARLFGPLGMLNTFFPDGKRSCAASFERTHDGRIIDRTGLAFPDYVHAAGGLCSSLDDLIKWDGALETGKVVPRELIEEAWKPARLADGSNARIAGSMSYGLGWAVETAPGHRWAGHSGGNATAFRRYSDDHMTVIVLHNGASDPDAIASSVAATMLAATTLGNAQADLWDAAGGGDKAAVEQAIAAGADVNALDTRSSGNGRYALNWAAINDHPSIIRLLLHDGAAIDAANRTGFTALHHAAESGSTSAAQALLAAGANAALRTASGETAIDVARRKGNTAVVRLIEGRAHAGRPAGEG